MASCSSRPATTASNPLPDSSGASAPHGLGGAIGGGGSGGGPGGASSPGTAAAGKEDAKDARNEKSNAFLFHNHNYHFRLRKK